MYFPYIRGRQYELLALKELVVKDLICDKVIPIVEPVKLTSTLINTISEYVNAGKKISIILNPSVGNFLTECEKAQPKSKEDSWCRTFEDLCVSDYVVPSLILNSDVGNLIMPHKKDRFLVVHVDPDLIDCYKKLFAELSPSYTLIPDDRLFRRNVTGEKVLFADKFGKKRRNADYVEKTDEYFSDDHLFFRDEGYIGFSDYSVIGNGYVEAGFAPYAVAIHVVYFDDLGKLRICHFVSDSNDDSENPAGKYYEALIKLNAWYHAEKNPPITHGINTFLEHFRKQTYPGLGTVKKLSLMHHLELISQFLEVRA